ncbi:MAG: response regulator transcription factor [Deltaproteobacteria bacterium]|nr:response regulator transcription factor [Deltaproteobacteria bacterium]
MANSKHILLIEDEPAIRDGLQNLFVFHGYRVSACPDGISGLSAALQETVHLVVLDVMLPGKDGFQVCQEIRAAKPNLPIVMLTAKTSEDDIINGLKLGADDYIPKPFSLRILLTKAESLIRRESRDLEAETLSIGPWLISGRNLEAYHTETKKKVELTSREIEILQFLFSRDCNSKTREELLSNVWGYRDASDIETRTVDIHIAKLRKKLESDPKNPTSILTVRGRGYRLVLKNEK